MAYDIGPVIGIEGEKEFKQAISGINKDLSVLGSEMGKVTAEFGTNANSMESLRSKSEIYNKQLGEQKKKVDTLKAALENSAKTYGENDVKTKNWQISLNRAEAELAKLNSKTEENARYLEEASKSADGHAKSIDEAGKKAKESGSNAEKGESGWSKLGSGLAKVGEIAGKAVAALGAAAGAAGTALVATSVSGAAYADEMKTMAQVTGLSTDQIQEFKYMQELVDVPLETMTKSLTKNVKSMGDAARGSKTAVEAYEKLGVQFQNTDGSLRDANDVYFESLDALGKMSNEAERDALAMQLFGKSARDLVPLIEAGSDELENLRQQAHDAGYVISGETLDAFGEFDDQLQYLKSGAEGAKNAVGTILLPVLTTLAGDGVNLLGEFTAGIQGANGDVGKMVDVVSDTLTKVIDKIMEYLPEAIEAGMQMLGAIGKGILDNLPVIIDASIIILTTLVSGLIDALPQLIEGALQLVLALADGISTSLPELIPAIVGTVLMIVETLIDNIDMLIDAALAINLALAEGMIDAIPVLVEKIPVIIDKLINAITENLPKILEMGIRIIIEVSKGLIKAIPQLVSKVPEILKSLIDGFTKGFSGFVDIGKNIVSGIWEGIQSMGEWIGEKVSGFFNGIVGGVKDFLGIKSPSRVFAGIGENMALGLGDGFDDEMDSVAKKIRNSVPTSFDIRGNYDIGGSSSVGVDYGKIAAVISAAIGDLIETLPPHSVDLVVDGTRVGRVLLPRITAEQERLGVIVV